MLDARQKDVGLLVRQNKLIKLFVHLPDCCNIETRTDTFHSLFQFYSYLSQQQNMMQDYVRTNTYQTAMLSNTVDFVGKTILDVGAGSGILSFFAVQAGARKVYAVEASNMAQFCEVRLTWHYFSVKDMAFQVIRVICPITF